MQTCSLKGAMQELRKEMQLAKRNPDQIHKMIDVAKRASKLVRKYWMLQNEGTVDLSGWTGIDVAMRASMQKTQKVLHSNSPEYPDVLIESVISWCDTVILDLDDTGGQL